MRLHNMPPKKRKQDDVKLEPVIDHARSAIEHISHCTMEELRLVFEAARRRQDRLSMLAANRFEPGDTVTWKLRRGRARPLKAVSACSMKNLSKVIALESPLGREGGSPNKS